MKRRKQRTRRIAAMLLALAMVVTSVPQYALTVSAAETSEDAVIAEEHAEAADTVVETETTVTVEEDSEGSGKTDAVKDAESVTVVENTENTETAETKSETENTLETEIVAKTEEETETKIETEVEQESESETDDALQTGDSVTVSFSVPYRAIDGKGIKKENLLQGFAYKAYDSEVQGDIQLEQYGASLDDLVNKGERINIEVPVGGTLYFKLALMPKCELVSIKYQETNSYQYKEPAIDDVNGFLKIVNVQNDINVSITAYRCFDVVFKSESAKFYKDLEAMQNGNELKELEVSEKQYETFYVVPDENKAVKSVDSNSTGIVVKKNKIKEENSNASMYTISVINHGTFKETTTILAVAEELNTYKATFDWSADDAEVFVGDDRTPLSGNETDITEGEPFALYVKPKDSEKGVYVEYIDEVSKETVVPQHEYNAESGEYLFYIGGEEGITGDVSIKISVAEFCNITLKAVNNYIRDGYYRYGTNESEINFEFPSVNEEVSGNVERECETKIKLPTGYELKLWLYEESEYGTMTASAENTEITKKRSEDEYYFSFTPTSDTIVTFDVAPAKFIVDADADVDFTVCKYNDDAQGYVDIELSDNNSINYYNSWDETRLKIKKETGKRYDVRGEIDDGDGGTMLEYIEELGNISGEEEDGYALYDISIGYYKKVIIRSYETATINVTTNAPEGSGLEFAKFYTSEEGWDFDTIEDNRVTADKNRDFFLGIRYNDVQYKLELTATGGSSSLELYDSYKSTDKLDGTEKAWAIYRTVPTADATITLDVTLLENYTVTVVKGSGVTKYTVEDRTGGIVGSEEFTDTEKTFENIKENSTFYIADILLEDGTNVRKAEYEVDGGTRRMISADYAPNWSDIRYHISITGNTTIYLDAVPAEEYTLKFDSTDGFAVKIWEEGNYSGSEGSFLLTDNQITLKNDKEYLFDILPEDGYIAERVVATGADGKETLVERKSNSEGLYEGYRIGTGYGNTGNLAVKVNLKEAYTLRFDTASASDLDIYSWEDWEGQERLNEEKIAIPAADSYSFYIPALNALEYKIAIKESDFFTLTRDYRAIKDEWDDSWRYEVYTVAPKKDVAQPGVTATVVIEPNDDTHAVTLSNEIPEQIKSVNIVYYIGTDGYNQNYKLTNNKANVTNSVYNTVRVNIMRGYTAKVTMTGASGTNELKLVRNDSGYLEFGIGELTEDKTITVTVERANALTYYSVGFATRNAIIRDPEYKLPYIYGEYYTNGGTDCSCDYWIAKGDSISFIVEPEYGYKVENVTVRDNVITADENGIYTVKVTRDEMTILVRTAVADAPDEPGKPDEPEKPDEPGKPDEPDEPAKKTSTVTFTCPAEVTVTVDDVKPENNQLRVEIGKQISFKAAVTDESYEIKSVTVDGVEIPYDETTGTYTITIQADTEIIVTTAKKQGEDNPAEKYTVRFDYPQTVAVIADNLINNQISDVAAGTTISFKASLTDEKYEIQSVTANDVELIYNETTENYNVTVNEDIIIKITVAQKQNVDIPDTSGLKVLFDGYKEGEVPDYTYTGSAVTPRIEVTYNGEYMEEGMDYTIKFANNINVSTDAKLTITGKGSLAGKHDYTFKITPKDIGESDVRAGSVKVVKNAKATPVLVYNGMVLGKKDFDNPKASEKFSDKSTITLTGKGNYTGTRTIDVEVVEKDKLNKISIKLDNAKNKNLAYDGTEKYPAFNVLDAKKTDITNKENEAYIVVYPKNIISAGTVKFTVVGIGDYTGTVTKSYKIKPSAKMAGDINVSEPSSNGYTFVSTGVTEYEPDVRLKDGTWLESGKDYTLAYSNNKKAGTAKCKINFIGNYKGIKAITKEFKINQFNIADFDEENIIVTDKTSAGKPGIYKSVPYIIDNEADALVKSSEFKFTYYVDEAMTKEMKGSDGKLTSGKIWVKIEPKNVAKGNYTGVRTVSYMIRESGKDLSKARITFNPNKPVYTGSPLTPECSIDGAPIKENDKYNVRYLNNINKGKATVIITGAEGSEYVGSKTATFTIAASDINSK